MVVQAKEQVDEWDGSRGQSGTGYRVKSQE